MNTFVKLYSFFLGCVLATSLGRGFMSFWFIQNGFSFPQVCLFYLIDYATPPVMLLFTKKFSTQKSFSLALISEIFLMFSFYRFWVPWQIYLSGILAGLTVVFFYITFNTLYFENTPKDKRATSTSLFVVAGPFLGIVIPLVLGFFGQKYGLSSVFLISAFILFLLFRLVKYLPKIEFESRLSQSLIKTSKINLLLFIEGVKESVSLAAIPLFTLFFIRQSLPYGKFLSYLAFLSAVATVFLGFISDKFKKRTIILYPVTTLVALSLAALGLASDISWWTILSGALSFLLTINGTFATTLVLDKISDVKTGMISREFLLGLGRVLGMALIYLSLSFSNSPRLALIFIGGLYFFFPLTIYFRKLYQD